MFDLDTQDTLGEGETSLEITCINGTDDALINSGLPAQICYSEFIDYHSAYTSLC